MDDRDGTRADWDDIKAFVAAAQTGSFGAAARRLRTTQPTVTRRIDDLEYRLGARLFDRGLRGVTLTRAGELVFDRAFTMQRASADIERLVLESEGPEAGGSVTVAMPEGIGGYLVGKGIADAETIAAVGGAAATIAAAIWSVYSKRKVEPQA